MAINSRTRMSPVPRPVEIPRERQVAGHDDEQIHVRARRGSPTGPRPVNDDAEELISSDSVGRGAPQQIVELRFHAEHEATVT